jgi:hypothetical protein
MIQAFATLTIISAAMVVATVLVSLPLAVVATVATGFSLFGFIVAG